MIEGSLKAMNLMTLLQSVAVSVTDTPMVVRVFEVNTMLGAVWLDGSKVLGCVVNEGLVVGEDAFLRLYSYPGIGGFRVYQANGDPFSNIDKEGLEASGPLGDLPSLILRTACRLDEETASGAGTGLLDYEGLA